MCTEFVCFALLKTAHWRAVICNEQTVHYCDSFSAGPAVHEQHQTRHARGITHNTQTKDAYLMSYIRNKSD